MSFKKLLNPLNKSIALRTTIIVVLLTTVIMLVGGLYQMYVAETMVTNDMKRLASKAMDGAIDVISNRVNNVETAVHTAAAFAPLFAQNEVLADTLMKKLIEGNNDIDAVTLLYKANYFADKGRYFAPTVYRDPETRKLTFDEIGGPEHNFRYLETDSNWVYTNKLDEGYWCLPYVDSMATKLPMVTYSVPLHDKQGDTYAVLCADVKLHWVRDIVETTKPYEYSKVSVLSRDARWICHPDSSCILTVNVLELAAKRNDTDLLFLTERMLRGDKGTDTMSNINMSSLDGKQQYAEDEEDESIVYFAYVDGVQWSICYTIPLEKIMEGANELGKNMFFLLIIMIVAISYTLYKIIRRQLRPMKLLAEDANQVANGNFHVKLPVVNTNDEVRVFRDAFDHMQKSLEKYIEDLKVSTANMASVEKEMKVANNIQMGMLPHVMPPFPDRTDFDLYAKLKPAKEVGGDLYDFLIRDEKLFFCIGDVSGKGVPAALFMAMTRSLFRNITATMSDLKEMTEALNNALCDGNNYNMFCTMFIGILNLKDGSMEYCNAGHNPAVLIHQMKVDTMTSNVNVPVGFMKNYNFSIEHWKLDKGDSLFLYTDGVTEAENVQHELYGDGRMLKVLKETCQQDDSKPKDFVNRVYESVKNYTEGTVQSDDITILHLRYYGKENKK